MKYQHLLQQAMPMEKADPSLRESENSKHLPGRQVHTAKIPTAQNQGRTEIPTHEKATTEHKIIPPTPFIS